MDNFFEAFENNAPDYFDRKTASSLLGGAIAPQTLANLDAQKQGCPVRRRIGRKVLYQKEAFIIWLHGRYNTLSDRPPQKARTRANGRVATTNVS